MTPSGSFRSVRDSPDGSFVDGIPAFERAPHIRSFRACIRPVASLQERPCKPLASTAALHGQLIIIIFLLPLVLHSQRLKTKLKTKIGNGYEPRSAA